MIVNRIYNGLRILRRWKSVGISRLPRTDWTSANQPWAGALNRLRTGRALPWLTVIPAPPAWQSLVNKFRRWHYHRHSGLKMIVRPSARLIIWIKILRLNLPPNIQLHGGFFPYGYGILRPILGLLFPACGLMICLWKFACWGVARAGVERHWHFLVTRKLNCTRYRK